MIQQQRDNAERNVDQKSENISGRLQQIKDELSGTSAGLQGQIDEVDRAMRDAFEGMGASLPPRRIGRIWRWVQCQIRGIRIFVWGK